MCSVVIVMGRYSLPLWMAIVRPTISGRIIMSRLWVRMVGFWPLFACWRAFRRRSRSLRWRGGRPRRRLRRWRLGRSWMNWSMGIFWRVSRSFPRYLNFLAISFVTAPLRELVSSSGQGFLRVFPRAPRGVLARGRMIRGFGGLEEKGDMG